MIASQVLQRTTTLLHMIHCVTSMDYCNFSEFPIIWALSHEMQSNNTLIQINPKHTLWEKKLAILETSKLFIIPLINHQNQPLDWISASLSTLRSGFSCTSVGDKNLIPLLEKNYYPCLKNQNHITYLLCCSSFCRSTTRFSLITLHLVAPLPHSHLVSNISTHIPNRRKRHKDFNTIKHHRISIQCSSLSPHHWE